MSSLLKSTLNTRALPIGGMRYIRSDAPLCLTEEEIQWLLDNRTGTVSALLLRRLGASEDVIVEDYMKSKENLMDMLTSYVRLHPEVDIDIIIPQEENIRKLLSN